MPSVFNTPQQLQNSVNQLQSLQQDIQNVQQQNFFTPAPFEPAITLPTISETAVSQFPPSSTYGVQPAMAMPYYVDNTAVYLAQPVNDQSGHQAQQLEQLNLQMAQLKSELEFHRSTAINLQKNTDELNRLRQEGQSHIDVVKVLVSEKSSLMDSLQKAELAVKAKATENEELQNRLNMSRHRVKQLESDDRMAPSGRPSVDLEAEAKRIEETVAEKIREFKESNARIESEREEIKTLLNQKRIEMENLQKNFDHLNTELHLANVKIAQLSDGSPVADNANHSQEALLAQELAMKQQRINDLDSLVDQINREKEASDNQYQSYVTHLTREMETLKENSLELTSENDSLVKREQELLKHVSDLEKQIQQNFQKQKTYAEDHKEPNPASVEELQKLASQITALTESNETLKTQLAKVEAEKNALAQNMLLKEEEMRDVELRMERLKTETPNLSQLMTDFEDKSVAASRALSQNLGLKEQLDEMQRAFITMTNDKMELTDKLQSEMHLCKEIKIRYDSMEVELKEMRDKWQFKEDEMIRLSHENTELEKKILQQNIEIDRLRHYESKEYHGTEGIVEKELENYRRLNVVLTNKINILEGREPILDQPDHSEGHGHSHDHSGHGHSHDHSGHGHSHEVGTHQKVEGHSHASETKKPAEDLSRKHLLEEIEMLKMEKSELLKAMQDFQISKKPIASENPEEIVTNGDPPEMNEETLRKISVMQTKSVTPSMATEEALEKLQARFRRTMLEVAELTEEKQRLEHVVTQLQFETETIGEYITLYQYQRRLLKQKERDRDIQLKSLAADREKMNQKLLQLNSLIEKFVLQHTDNVELALEATKLLEEGKDSEPLIIHPASQPNEELLKLKQETAGKILEILSDIKTANSTSYETCVGVENCSCCLGKLETV